MQRSLKPPTISESDCPPADNKELFNVLVHEYMEIDRHRVYAVLEGDLGDFEAFVKAVSKLL